MSEETYITIKNYYERTIEIDDEDGNVCTLPIRIRRFTVEQLQAFSTGWQRCQNRLSSRLITRKPDGEEQQKRTVTFGDRSIEAPLIPDSEIRQRRLVEMAPDERDRFEALEAEDEHFISSFSANAVREHVWLPPHVRLVFDRENGEAMEVRTGEQVAAVFAGNASILSTLTNAVREENTLSAAAKKNLRSLSASRRSSREPTRPADGAGPDEAAPPASSMDSAQNEAATGAGAPNPSGSTETSSSTCAQS